MAGLSPYMQDLRAAYTHEHAVQGTPAERPALSLPGLQYLLSSAQPDARALSDHALGGKLVRPRNTLRRLRPSSGARSGPVVTRSGRELRGGHHIYICTGIATSTAACANSIHSTRAGTHRTQT
ncbi:hypothetical protein C8T65DRAFT_659297 [Cerioporus squamosus]|nr:hypothetical protein C8T65DRAFT_659297 [Cerioporus squamosus]